MDIWTRKYQNKGESFEEWLKRVSGGNQEMADYIREKKFLYGGRILSNRGLNKEGRKVTYSNCYVITPPEDNIESIFDCAKKLARTYSYGGGCGIDISGLSPRGAKINNAAKETSGSVSFMDLYSMVTGLIGQNGRRGALMISLDCSHPDVPEFIEQRAFPEDYRHQLGLCRTGSPVLGPDYRMESFEQYGHLYLCRGKSLCRGTPAGRRKLSSGKH